MTATRKAPARRPRPRPELRMPYFYCTRPACGYEFQPTGDYRDTASAAQAAGWLYVQGTGWLCPGDAGWVPWWPQPAGRLALPAPDVPRPGPTVSAVEGAMPVNAPGPGDPEAEIIIVRGGHITIPYTETPPGHLTLDPEPLPDLPRPGQSMAETAGPGPGQPDATVSFAVTGETQPIGRPHPDHGKPFTELEEWVAGEDAKGQIQP